MNVSKIEQRQMTKQKKIIEYLPNGKLLFLPQSLTTVWTSEPQTPQQLILISTS